MTACLGIGVGLTDISVLGGAGRPTAEFNFAAAAYPTTGLAFGRAGDRTGTVVDFEKVIWRCKLNELRLQGLRRVENWVPNSNSPQNATVNTFAPAPSTNSVVAPDGTTTAWQILAGTTGFGQSNLAIPADRSAYILSEYVKALAPGARVFLVANGINTVDTTSANTTSYYDFDTNSFGPGVGVATAQDVGNGWIRISRKFQNNGAGTTFLVRTDAQPESAGKTAYWGFQLERVPTAISAASEYVSNGVLSSPFHGVFVDGVKCFATDRSGTLIADVTREGAFLEEAGTNIALRSEEFGDAVWQYQDTTVTADNTTSPDGSINADLLTEGVAGTARCLQPVTITANTVNTWSLFLKRGNHDWVRIGVYDPTLANSFQGWINLATGALGASGVGGTGTLASFRVFDAGNGWYRVCISGNLGGAITTAWPLTISATADNSGTRVNNGTRYQWGAQFEQRTFPSAYVPTAGASATRSLDTLLVTSASLGFNLLEGSYVADYKGTPAGNGPVISGTTVGSPSIVDNDGGNNVRVSLRSVAYTDTGGTPTTEYVRYKTAYGFKQGDHGSSTNGGAVQTSANATVLVDPVNIFMGISGVTSLCGPLKSFKYYPRRLTNAELQAATA